MFKSDRAIGNETLKEMPKVLNDDGSFNTGILSQMGDHFETHFAFRPQLINADARIQALVFNVSNADAVITGTNGWLFYRSTLDDFLGRAHLSERGLYNLAHNLSLIQSYVLSTGARFLFMSPPNKNSLYPDNMPYYYQVPFSAEHNRDGLKDALLGSGVAYLDLFELFEEIDEVLYLKEDSHWNNKGARMVFDRALSFMGKEHDDLSGDSGALLPIHHGDLAKMIYPAETHLEDDYQYTLIQQYDYIPGPGSSDPVSVEDFRIETKSPVAEGTLLMYRDSFSNTLIPFMSNEFSHAYYSKSVPYTVAKDIEQFKPGFVIIELVERNLSNIVKSPAAIPSPRIRLEESSLKPVDVTDFEIKLCEADPSLVEFRGIAGDDSVDIRGDIFVVVPEPDGSRGIYAASNVSTEETDYGFSAFRPLAQFGTLENALEKGAEVMVYTN